MKEETQGFPAAWGSIEFPLHPKALEVPENEFIFGKSKLTMGSTLMGLLQKHGWCLITFLCPACVLCPPVCRQIVQSGHVSLMGTWWWATHALMFECELLLCMGRGEIALPLFGVNHVRCSFLPALAQNAKNTEFAFASDWEHGDGSLCGGSHVPLCSKVSCFCAWRGGNRSPTV